MALTRPRYSQIPDTDWKQSVRVATTEDVGNVMLAAMPNTVDGVTLNFYDRVLLRSQANAAQNGIYYVKAVGTGSNGIWERTKDAASGGALGAVTPSIVTQVEEGTVNKNRTFKLTTTGNIDLGTTDLSFGVQAAEPAGSTGQLQFANVNNVIGGATTTSYDYTTGNLTLTGNVNTTLLYQNGKRVAQVFTSTTPPVTPAVGDQWYQVGTDILYEWLQDGATAYWIDISGATIANINPITGQNIGTLVVNGGNESTSTTTGALQVVGGVGITGNLNVGGAVSFGGGQLGSDLVISSNTTSISETTGAIRIASPGGLGVGGNIWAGGTIVANSRIPSTSITTGAFVVPGIGGIGIGGNVWVGQDVNVIGNITGGGVRQTIGSTAPVNPTVGDQWYQLGTDILYQYVSDGTGKYWVDIAGATVANISAQSQQSLTDIQIVSGTPSTSASTGALTVSGGVGIQGNLNLAGGFNVSGGNIVANQNITSTNTTTGSMIITEQGGLGVGGNVNVGGNLSVAQSASFLQNVIISANLVASGTYFAAGGLSVTNGNVVASGTTAQIGGLTITAGAISGLTNLGVTGNITLGGTLSATGDISTSGNISGGGLRKYAQINAPVAPIVGDVWYKTDTDVYYTYVNDGTNKYWIDYAGATVANISPQTNQTLNDIVIVSGTPATNTTTGALQVQGGAGITGNVFAGNLNTATVSATNFTYANGVSILEGNQGTYSNANVVAYLAASDISIGGNLTAGSSYFSAGGLSVTAGNILATGARAVIGGLTIENGGISSLASLNVVGSGTLGGDFAITGNITAGGLRKYAQVGAPTNPVVGDVWYKTDTDVFYQYVNDGTSKYWIDYTSATVSNASPTSPQSLQDLQIVSGTPSTGSGTGALQVTGGAAVTGNVFAGNLSTTTVSASAFTYANGVSILLGNEGTYSNANVTAYLTARSVTIADGNITATGGYLAAGGFTATAGNIRTTSANIGGVIIESGGIGQLASLGVLGAATIGGDVAITGNITAGGLRKYAQIGAPANPVVGDVWYKTDTDVYYQYITDGTKNIWVDYSSATVSNASPTTSQSLQDLQIVSGTQSTSTSTGALVVQGGIGASGNIFVGNVSTATVSATNFTYANGVSILAGNEGTYSNANVTAYLTARTTTISDGFLSTAGMTVTAGNLKTTSANIGSVIIENGGISQLASLGVVGAATIGGDLAVTGNITGGGLRKYAQPTAPANPVVGDVWYKTDTDVYYQYINDGSNKFWVDYVGATVSNASITSSQISYDIVVTTDTQSTSTTTGAVRVQGGIGLIGNIYTTGIADFGGNLTANNIKANNNLQTNTLAVVQNATVGGTLTVTGTATTGNLTTGNISGYGFNTNAGNLTATGQYFAAGGISATAGNISVGNIAGYGFSVNNGNIVATGDRAEIGGLVIENGAFADLSSLGVLGAATIGADLAVTGNITGGGLRKYAQVGAPANPVVGDVWYKTDTDVFYQYVNDGTNKYWIDYTSATVSNASPTSPQSLQDLQIVSGTNSTSTSTGALVVQGGAGISGNVNAGNVTTGTLTATTVNASGVVVGSGFTYANGVSILVGNEGTYSNSNVTAYLTARTTTISDGFLSTAGMTVTAGNLKTTSANIGGLIIENGGFGSLASLGVVGAATIGGDLAVTGNITGGGLRKYAQISAPANPVVGDVWYKTDTDVYYTYINDGTNKYWVDYIGATVSNASITSEQIAYDIVITTDTQSTSTTTGAVRVQGGIGLIGNIYTTGIADFGGNLTAGNILSNNNLQTTTLQVVGDTNVNKLTAVGNITSAGTYFSAAGLSVTNGNVVATGTTATIGGLVINNGGLPSLPSIGVIGAATFGANVDVTGNVTVTRDIVASGNIVAGGVRKYAQTTKPTNAVPGDVWYKTDTDVYYTYVNDGTSSYWIDYVGATVSNAAVDNSTNNDFTIASGTASTDPNTGALVVVGGVGVTGDINTTGDFTIDGTFTACTAVTAGYLNVADGIDSYGNVIIHGPGTTNYTVQVRSSDAADDVLGIKTSVAGGGFAIDALNSELIGATPLGINANTFSVGIKNGVGTTVQADAFKLDTAGNASVAKTLSVGQHVNVTGNVSGNNASFTKVIATTANFATLNLSGTLTVPTLNVTTSIDAPGIRKYAQSAAPANPVAGDIWYKTDTDVYYTYVNDGTNNYWIDYVGATVSNAATTASQSVDLRVASGTDSTNTDTGAVTVVGGVGITGNINVGGVAKFLSNLVADSRTQSTNTTTGAIVVPGVGGIGIGGAAFIGQGANIGTALNVGTSVTIGSTLNVGSTANIVGNFNTLGNISVQGRADITGNLDVVGRITGGGIRKTTSLTAPVSPMVGDLWYKTDTDVLYQYINDGASNVWVDYVGPTVSNASPSTGLLSDLEIVTGTSSTSTITGAARITGGVGITENLYVGGLATIGANLLANNITANVNLQSATLAISGSGAVVGNLTTGNLSTGIATIARADIAGALAVGGDVTVTGNIVAGGVRKTQSTTAPVNPTVGDLWYKTDTDVYYQYTSDGTNKYWIDYVGATVSNAAVSASTNNDYRIASGTASTNTDTGALTVVGGVGITGNVNIGGSVIATGFYSDNFSFANGTTLADRITGTFSNSNVAAYLTGAITTGNITAGNISTTDITARDITARNVTLSGNITGGGLRKYAQIGAPANPIVGDVWYKTDTDVYYQYINDGTNSVWVDYIGATISNASVNNSINSDLLIASGTLSTSDSTGALQVVGGVGVVGNINLSENLTAAGKIIGSAFTYANGVSILAGNEGTYSNANVTAYLTARTTTISDGFLSTAGMTVTAGNLKTTSANIGGLIIENSGISSLASLGVIGSATVGADLAVTGNITGGGLRKYAQDTAPVNPVVGDVWYKTDSDVYYQYINDGTNKFWVDYVGATVSNASITSSQISYDIVVTTDTQSTSTTTGAVRVQGGIGLIGNIYTTGIADFGGNLRAGNVYANNNTQTNTLAVVDNATIGGTLDVTGSLSAATLSTGNSTVGNIAGYGFTTNAGNLTASGAYFSAGGMSSTNGNITVGNINAYSFIVSNGNITSTGTYARVGGLEIINGGFSSLASLGVVGSATIGADLAVTGNITGGGLRKTQSTTPPANPVQGDVWYKTDTDVYYQYINDGNASYWIDYVSATVANVTQNAATVSDLQIVSGTTSTSTSTGALTVAGGVGITSDVNIGGNASIGANTAIGGNVLISSGATATQHNTGALIIAGNGGASIGGNLFVQGTIEIDQAFISQGFGEFGQSLGTNGNIDGRGDKLTGGGFKAEYGNVTATGAYFSAAGLTVLNGNVTGTGFNITNGNVITTGAKAVVGGLTIENGSFGNIASLSVIGSATIGGDVTITGNVTGGGIRKTTSINAPANPVVGDVWYKTDTDVLYQYVNDGASNVWVDYVSATVANITSANAQYGTDVGFVSGTLSTDQTTGAVTVIGGVGITGNINLTGKVTAFDTVTGQAIVSNTSIAGATLVVAGDTSVGNLTAGNVTGYGFTTNNGNVTATGNISGYGFATSNGNLSASGAYFSAGGMSSTNGNITVGNINAYSFIVSNGNITSTGTYARIGGLEIINGGFGSLASLGVIGSATIGGDVAITGNVTGGGIRKTTSSTAPVNPIVGDIWYKADTDVYYEYINDGIGTYWVDMVSPTVANVTQSAETVSDLEIVSGTPSIDPTTGALRVAGGVGVTGDVNISSNITVGNVHAGTVYTPAVKASLFAYPNGASILSGYYFGTYSNANVTGYLTAEGITTAGGNLVATGAYFSAGGITATAGQIATNGNIVSQGTYAKIGGLEITNGGFANLASLGVVGTANIGGDVAITGNITAGGLRKYAQTSAPANPVVGDVWYKTDTDVYYQYISDGTTNVWVDFVSATVANITAANAQYGADVGFVSGTLSTSPQTGAVTVIGGVGITGNINTTGQITTAQQAQVQSLVSNTSIAGATLSIAGDTAVGNLNTGSITATGNVTATGKLTVGGLSVVPGNLSASGTYFSAGGLTSLNGNLTATGTTATIGGLTIANGGFGSIASLDVIGTATIGGNLTVTGNIVGGGVRKTTSMTAPALPTVGDQWYKTDTDVLYQFIDDGTSTYWIDVSSATVANITNDFDGLGDFQTIGNVIGNGIVSDNYYYANGVSFVTTTVANTANITANITNGFNLGLDLTPTGVSPGNYGSSISIPTIVVDDKGRISSITSNAVSTTFGLTGNVGSSSISGGNTLVIVGTPNQISTTISGNVIEIGFTPNITFTDFTVSGNLIYQGGGIKTTTSPTPPAGPTNGDMWYQSGTDILYRYVNDGTSEYWLDLFSTPLRAVLPSRDIGGGDGEVQYNDNGTFGANAKFAFDKTTGTLKVERFRITQTQSPVNPTSPGLQGEITWDGQWMYVCIAPNSWVRAGLYTW